MSNEIVCTTDVHGAFYTLIRLLNQIAALHPGARLISLGDEIDRGKDSRKVVEFMMENKISSVKSNHCDLCLAYSEHARRGYRAKCAGYYERDIWLWNGGEDALANWPHYRDAKDGGPPYQSGCRIPDEVLNWMRDLPPYIISDTVDDQGRKCLFSHTGFGLDADLDTSDGWMRALWGRYPDEADLPKDGYYRVWGHNRGKTVEDYADVGKMIDTGAAYKGYGVLTAFVWPTKAIVQQQYDETPVEARFRIENGCIFP